MLRPIVSKVVTSPIYFIVLIGADEWYVDYLARYDDITGGIASSSESAASSWCNLELPQEPSLRGPSPLTTTSETI
jgi:hypothetical protein